MVETTAALDSSWMDTGVGVVVAVVAEDALEELADELFAEPRTAPFLSAASMAFRVFLPARPSTLSPFSFWKRETALRVLVPNLPSALPDR